ncbi:unnamed protein product [Closterium sp. NIES-65]|nr:unnamed protein product [Closterium sp. NIES-65]
MTTSRVLAVLGLICVALCVAGASAQATPPPKPTKAQIKAELNNLATNITKRYPQYAKYAKDINRYIGLALNSKYDFSALADATILLPSDPEAQALAKKLPAKSSNLPTIYNITAYHIIRRKLTVPPLKSLKKSQPLATQLKQAIYKVSPQNGNAVSFARGPNAPAAAWTTIKIARLYAGPYFIAHGVDKILIPAGTTMPKSISPFSALPLLIPTPHIPLLPYPPLLLPRLSFPHVLPRCPPPASRVAQAAAVAEAEAKAGESAEGEGKEKQQRRVVVTGMGIVSCLSMNAHEFYQKLLDGTSGISAIEGFDASEFPTCIAGEIKEFKDKSALQARYKEFKDKGYVHPKMARRMDKYMRYLLTAGHLCMTWLRIAGEIKVFKDKGYVHPKMARRMDKYMRYLLTAGKRALRDAHMSKEVQEGFNKQKCGVLIGSAMGGMQVFNDAVEALKVFNDAVEALKVSYRRMNPFCIPFVTTNMGSAMLAMDLVCATVVEWNGVIMGWMGPNYSISTACATANYCILSLRHSFSNPNFRLYSSLSSPFPFLHQGWMGPNYSISTACATANYCILAAAQHIQRGDADVMLSGGSDAPVLPLGPNLFMNPFSIPSPSAILPLPSSPSFVHRTSPSASISSCSFPSLSLASSSPPSLSSCCPLFPPLSFSPAPFPPLTPFPGLGGFVACKALSKRNDEPERASRPWDKHANTLPPLGQGDSVHSPSPLLSPSRAVLLPPPSVHSPPLPFSLLLSLFLSQNRDGFVMGEGAGVLVLEELEHAKGAGVLVLEELEHAKGAGVLVLEELEHAKVCVCVCVRARARARVHGCVAARLCACAGVLVCGCAGVYAATILLKSRASSLFLFLCQPTQWYCTTLPICISLLPRLASPAASSPFFTPLHLVPSKARGATIYAEFLGGSVSCDAHHMTDPHPQGKGVLMCIEQALASSVCKGVLMCIEQALASSGVPREYVNYVNAHATSTLAGDVQEYKALVAAFGNNPVLKMNATKSMIGHLLGAALKMNATKSMIGHLLGAAGGVEAIATVGAIHTGYLHPNLNLENLEDGLVRGSCGHGSSAGTL